VPGIYFLPFRKKEREASREKEELTGDLYVREERGPLLRKGRGLRENRLSSSQEIREPYQR